MKNFCKLFGITAIVTVIGFSMIACDDGSGTGDNNGTGINIGQLPEFPSGSTPAGTKTDAETILVELRQSPVLDSIQKEIREVVNANRPDHGNYSFSNRSLPNGFVRVSDSYTENETNTGGFQTLSANRKTRNDLRDAIDELYDADPVDYTEIERLYDELDRLEEARYSIQFAAGNRANGTWNGNQKGELTKAKTEGGVTVAQGSTYETKDNGSENVTVTTAGTYETFRMNSTFSGKEQTTEALTVTTSSGSVKIILDMTGEGSETGNNVKYSWDEDDTVGTWTETEKYSGSLKVYGSNNAVLIDHRIVDWESFDIAYHMIKHDPYASSFNPANATPLADNVKVNGNISSEGSTALYSINVTGGTKYYWWCGVDADNYVSVSVKGYNSNGIVFSFDGDGSWWGPDGGGSFSSFTATSTGTVYIMVYPNSEYDTGTFAIVYNTTGNQPAMSVSFIAPSSANSRSVQNKTDSVVTPKKATGVLRHNRSVWH
jgi:hypothetical protein